MQIEALLAEKESRSAVQGKISSNLLHEMKMSRGQEVAPGVKSLQTGVEVGSSGLTLVDIRAKVTARVLKTIGAVGGTVASAFPQYDSIRARVPIQGLEEIARLSDVIEIHPAAEAMTQRMVEMADEDAAAPTTDSEIPARGEALGGRRSKLSTPRAETIRGLLSEALPATGDATSATLADAISPAPLNTSQGVVTHRIDVGRATFGTTGARIKIGVLSDSVDFLPVSQASGDLGPVTVLPGQSGMPRTGEGTAMLEIVHDIAPHAELFFATAFGGPATFASNIMALRAAGCDIIIDDVLYFNESPFQDGIIAQAVNSVTADGALYFSAAGNSGSLRKARAGVYEGDFVASGTAIPGVPSGAINRFSNGTVSFNNNRIAATSGGAPVTLFWSDPLGASANDYDLFVLDTALTTVVDASTNIQNGTQDPFEQTHISPGVGRRIVVVKKANAAERFLHLNTNRGRLDIATTGQTKGHGAAADAFSCAATPAAGPLGAGNPSGPFPNPFSSSSVLELQSSDGPRRIFFDAGGALANPANPSLLSDGGVVRAKPDLTAADGVLTSVPGFASFFGTSAAAPHAAGIAALIKSAAPLASPSEIRSALTSSAIDIEGPGPDINAGAGIVMADAALLASGAMASAVVRLGTVTATPTTGDGNAFVDPGESADLVVELSNLAGAAAATAIRATLSSSSPGVKITSGSSAYPDIAAGGSATGSVPFAFSLSPDASCGQIVEFTMTVTYSGGPNSPETFLVRVTTGMPGLATRFSFKGPAVPIPDGVDAEVPGGTATVPLVVSGLTGHISDLTLSLDGTAASTAMGATTVGLDHSFVGDLLITLTSPSGTTVTLVNRLGAGLNEGPNFFNTVLSDAASLSIQQPTNVGPFTGTFKPSDALAAFDGEDPNGTWTLKVSDFFVGDFGSVRAFSLSVTAAFCDCPDMALSPPSLPDGIVGVPYRETITAKGGSAPHSFAVAAGRLPKGLTLDPRSGEIVGTPAEAGSFAAAITATDALGCTGSESYRFAVSLPGLDISDVTVTEGSGGRSSATFLMTLSVPVSQTVSVDYATADGTATAGADYVAGTGTVTFSAGQTVRAVTVMVNGDTLPEPTESFFVNLSNPVGGAITDGQGVGTILDDDEPLTLSIADTTVMEGHDGVSAAAFVVRLSRPVSSFVSVSFASADGTALAGSDYVSGSGLLVFSPGETTQAIAVSVTGDTRNEPNETFFVHLTASAEATIVDGQATALILDDDPLLVINDATMAEGNDGPTGMILVASLSNASPLTVTADFTTSNGTALAGMDYVAVAGTLTFAPGEVVKLVTVPVMGDIFVEPGESFFVTLSNASNASLARGQAVGTITNDDQVPGLAAIAPGAGPPGTKVIITGTNLLGAISVSFNGAVASFTAVSATSIRATVPANATTGPISVLTPGGTGTSAVFVVQARISSFTPTKGGADRVVTISGSGFADASSVQFGGAEAAFTVVSPTSITATVPAGATTGKISVTTGGGTVVSANSFAVITPQLTFLKPTSGKAGSTVTIAGVNFTGASSVKFGGVSASFTVLSSTSIRATVPNTARSGPISVTTPGGTITSAESFLVLPSVTTIDPACGGAIGATVTIHGSGFVEGATDVRFNGTSAASVTFVSPVSVKAVVPPGATSGPVSVATPNGTAAGPVFKVRAAIT